MNTTAIDIKNLLDQQTRYLQNVYNVKTIGIFGSIANNQSTKKSDVDILVELSEPISLFQFIDMEDFLSKILKRKVDLTTKNALKPAIKEAVLHETIYV
ncbi:MAG: nucleotidyltransferase family protein [Patescibacteria group bacterium]